MSKLKTFHGKEVDYTMIPNWMIRNPEIDSYDLAIYCCIASCNPSFPSYEKMMEWTGVKKRNRITKSLKKLELMRLIRRYKIGRQIYYETFWNSNPREPLTRGVLVTYGYRTSNPGEPEPVTQGNPKKNNEKEQLKIANENSENGQSEIAKVIDFALSGKGIAG